MYFVLVLMSHMCRQICKYIFYHHRSHLPVNSKITIVCYFLPSLNQSDVARLFFTFCFVSLEEFSSRLLINAYAHCVILSILLFGTHRMFDRTNLLESIKRVIDCCIHWKNVFEAKYCRSSKRWNK